MSKGIYDVELLDSKGNVIDLSTYKGKKLLLVNVASECGYTPQYSQLQELHAHYKDKVAIIGIPCNDFGGQEPGTSEEVVSFCQLNYGVEFLISEKVGILNNVHPLYQWLTKKNENGKDDHEVKWNFHKFLIDEDGEIFASLPSDVSPLDDTILSWLSS